MRKIGPYLLLVFFITILIPTSIVKIFNFKGTPAIVEGGTFGEKIPIIPEKKKVSIEKHTIDKIRVYNTYTREVEELELDDYVKGVVAAEMPAAFHIEALKAQAIAARTYAISRTIKYSEGHPDHEAAPLCNSVHCQAYLSYDKLEEIHGQKWIDDYWEKIEESVNSTKDLLIYFKGEIVEPLYHSTSGGMTEDALNVFAVDSPYLKSVISPFEEEAPKYKTVINLTGEEFINKINNEYKDVNISKENLSEKIKLIEKTSSGRIKKIAIENTIIDGRDMRELFGLNSTNFTITYDKKINLIEITTYGYGHGVGMSQWGANGMAKKGQTFLDILKHYYTDVEIK